RGDAGGGLDVFFVHRVAGHHVDDGEERSGAVERRPGPADDFDAVDLGDVGREVAGGVALAGPDVVHRVAVPQNQDPGVVVARRREAANAEVGVLAVVGQIEAAHRLERLGEGGVTEGPNLFGGN